jgi:pimeloyl-ACP methyl ester carboxylesterase
VTTPALSTPHGVELERLVAGAGHPVTVFAHGLGCTIPETRPLGSGVAGTKVFFSFRGHGGSSTPADGWGYAGLAQDLAAVADAHGATRAVATSMGAGALCRLLAGRPDRFERCVFFLPAVLDESRAAEVRPELTAVAAAVESGDAEALAALVRAEVPAAVAGLPTAAAFVRQRVEALLGSGVSAALRALPGEIPLPGGAGVLAAVTAPALVLACQGDPLHPVPVAERLATILPNASLHVYDEPDVLWRARADLRQRISGFLNGQSLNGQSACGRPARKSSNSVS